jgi:hypothetical protein
MQLLLATIVTLLAAAAPNQQPQVPAGLLNTPPMTLTFGNGATLDEAVSTLSRLSGVAMEFGPTVPEDVRKQRLAPESPVVMRNVTLEQAMDTLTKLKGLSFAVVNQKTIFIFKKE